MAFSPDAQQLACAATDGSLTLWGLDAPAQMSGPAQIYLSFALPHTSTTQVTCLAFSDDSTLLVGRAAHQVEIWDLIRQQQLFEFNSPLPSPIRYLALQAPNSVICSSSDSVCILSLGL
jgi:WD40 repeat protein